MSLQSSVGNVTRSATESVKSILSTTTGKIENTIGTATTAVTNVWSGGFAGISTANATALENAINTYIQGIQDTIQGFNENANLENAYKGAEQEFLHSDLSHEFFPCSLKNSHKTFLRFYRTLSSR